MGTARLLAVLFHLAGTVAGGTARAASFADLFGPRFEPIKDAFAESVGRSLPVTAASAGFVYTFDPETGVFERETALRGQLFLEIPEPIGRRRWNVSLNYQRVEFDTFEGKDIDRLRDTGINDPDVPGLRIPLLDLGLDTHQFTASGTYGVTDDLDFNVTVPLLYSRFRLRVRLAPPPGFEVPCQRQPCTTRGTSLGVGDIFLRGKYRFLRQETIAAAAGLILRVPTGDQDNFQGTGAVELAPMLYASTRRFPAGRSVQLQPYLNAGINFNADAVDRSEGRWGIGIDCSIEDWATVAVAFLGRHAFQRFAPRGAFDVDRCVERGGPVCTPDGRAPLFGIESERPDFYDLSVGWRLNVWRDTLIAYANAIIPLNADGLRAEVIPLVGVEATF